MRLSSYYVCIYNSPIEVKKEAHNKIVPDLKQSLGKKLYCTFFFILGKPKFFLFLSMIPFSHDWNRNRISDIYKTKTLREREWNAHDDDDAPSAHNCMRIKNKIRNQSENAVETELHKIYIILRPVK